MFLGHLYFASLWLNKIIENRELSVAFLGGLDPNIEHNKWYPFNREQVREHDPRAFDMLCRIWGVEVQDDNDERDSSQHSQH